MPRVGGELPGVSGKRLLLIGLPCLWNLGRWPIHYHSILLLVHVRIIFSRWTLAIALLQLTLEPRLLDVDHLIAKVLIFDYFLLANDIFAHRFGLERLLHIVIGVSRHVNFIGFGTHVTQAMQKVERLFVVQVLLVKFRSEVDLFRGVRFRLGSAKTTFSNRGRQDVLEASCVGIIAGAVNTRRLLHVCAKQIFARFVDRLNYLSPFFGSLSILHCVWSRLNLTIMN